MLLSGDADLEISSACLEMIPGRIFYVHAGAVHRIHSVGESDAMILEMAHGSDADIVRLADDYGRVLTTTKKGE